MPGGGKVDPCQKRACELQECLQKNNYQEEKCADAIKRYKIYQSKGKAQIFF